MTKNQTSKSEPAELVVILEERLAKRTAELRATNEALEKEIQECTRAQQALVESEQKYRTIVEHAAEGIVVIQGGRRAYYNPTWLEMTGYSAEEYDSLSFLSIVYAEDLEAVEAVYHDALSGEGFEPLPDFRIVTKSGDVRWLSVAVTRIEWEGKPAGTILVTDVTEQKQAEEQLRFQAHLLEAVEQAVIVTDLEGRVVYWNPFAERLFGWSAEEAMGKRTVDLVGVGQARSDGSGIITQLQAGKNWSVEYTARRRDGMSFPIQVNLTPIYDAHGELHSIIGIAFDITQRREAEAALRQSEEQYRALVEQAQDGIALVQDGKIRFANSRAAGLLGYAVEEMLDTPFEAYLVADQLPEVASRYQERLEGDAVPTVYEVAVRHRDGSLVHVEVSVGLTTYEGKPADLVFVRDVTERKVVEQQIMEYQGRLQALASQLTLSEERERRRIALELHDEVGQRLTFARMALASARETTSEARREAILDDVSQSVRQAIAEIRDLIFDLSSPLMNEVGLAAALEEWLENQVGKKHGLRVKLVNDGRRLPLDDDVRAMLFRSTRELLTNVVKHARAESVIVCLEGEGTMVRITVKDDGIGLDPDALPRATERGSGFGLFSIQERMAALGGSLELLSAPGQGCKAILIAPVTLQWSAGKTLEE